jgi:hypothetical protein
MTIGGGSHDESHGRYVPGDATLLLTLMVGLLPGVAMVPTDMTSPRVTEKVRNLDGGVLPGVTIEVKCLQKPQGGW